VPQPLNQDGTFRGQIIGYGLNESAKTGSVSLYVKARITEAWDFGEKSWTDWREFEVEAEGNLNIVKKDGAGPNEKQVASIVAATSWDGSLTSLATNQWQPPECQFSVKADVYEGVTRYKIDWMNPYDATPGGGGNVDADKAKALDAKYGSQFRALTGNVKRNGPKTSPNGPPAPRRVNAPVPSDPNMELAQAAAEADPDGIPFAFLPFLLAISVASSFMA
jgi:hypothetical protein